MVTVLLMVVRLSTGRSWRHNGRTAFRCTRSPPTAGRIRRPDICFSSFTTPFQTAFRCRNKGLSRQTVMADDFVASEDVFFTGPTSDVVQNKRLSSRAFAVGNDAYVGKAAPQIPGNDVAGQKFFVMGLIAFALEIGGDVGYAAVVDVAVGLGQAPFFRVGGKIFCPCLRVSTAANRFSAAAANG